MTTQRNSRSAPILHHTALTAAALAFAVGATAAFAQVRQIPQGRAIDANPQIGSGGSNNPVPGYVPINPNAIIENQVGGLAGFHGRVGSSSPYIFQGNLGSSSLDNFAKLSASGVPTSPGSYNPVFFLPSTVVSTAQGSIYSAPMGNGFQSNAIVPASSLNPTVVPYEVHAVGPFAQGIPLHAYDVNAPAVLSPGAPGALLSSPLDQLLLQPPAVEIKPAASTPTTTQPAPGATSPPPTVDDPLNSKPDIRTLPVNPANEGPALAKAQNIGDQTRLSAAYLTLQGTLEKAQAEALAANPTPPTPPTPPNFTSTALANSRIPPKTLTLGGVTYQSTDPTKPNYLTRSQILDRMNSLENEPLSVLHAGKKVNPLKTLVDVHAGQEVTPFDKFMKDGEDLLKQGKYLDAADAYQSALLVQPDNPLAIIGRAHAELGAGMFESAAFDLKFIYTKKPALISVRYDLDAFLPPQRLAILFADLVKLTDNKDTGNTASFLYCYLAYNTGRSNDLQQEVDHWSTRTWRDSWQAVIAKAWIK